MEERQRAYKNMSELQGGRMWGNTQMFKSLTQNIWPDISGTRHKLRSFWAGPYEVMKILVPALTEIKSVYYHGEEKLVSLDVLKLYQGEDAVHQNLKDVDLDQWLDEGELTKLPEVHREEMEVGAREQPELIAKRERVHKRIQAEIQHEDKKAEVAEELMSEVPPDWNAVPDLIMEDDKGLMITETDTNQKRDEVA